MRGDHSPSDIALVGDPSEGVNSVEQSGGVWGGHVVHGPRIGVGGPHQPAAGQDQDPGAHAGRPVLTATTIRGDCAGSSRGRGCRPPRSPQPSGTSSAVSSRSFRAWVIASVMALMAREIVGWDTPSCSPITNSAPHCCAQADQRRFQGIPQPHARRTPLDALLAQADEQVGELGSGQPHGILRGDGPFPMMLSSLMFVEHCTSWGRAIIIAFPGNARRRPLNNLPDEKGSLSQKYFERFHQLVNIGARLYCEGECFTLPWLNDAYLNVTTVFLCPSPQ